MTGICSEKAEVCEGKMPFTQLTNLDLEKTGFHSTTAGFVNNCMTQIFYVKHQNAKSEFYGVNTGFASAQIKTEGTHLILHPNLYDDVLSKQDPRG